MWELLTRAAVTLPDGRTIEVEPKDWLETVKWLYAHVDGPPKAQTEQTGMITVQVVYEDYLGPAEADPDSTEGET